MPVGTKRRTHEPSVQAKALDLNGNGPGISLDYGV